LVPEYDWFNRVSSFGLDSQWRREVARMFNPAAIVLDVGTGTGDLAAEIARGGGHVVGVDFSERMVEAARKKLGHLSKVSFQVAEANRLPFEAHSFHGVTSAFVLRNLHHGKILQASLREFYRVLKPHGQMVHVELTRPQHPIMAWGHQMILRTFVPLMGRVLFRHRWPRSYLRDTIRNFPSPEALCQTIRWAGFEHVRHYPLCAGVANLFVGVRCSN
jgi:demethylmenaquinone methyltransferase/2-methoxy-6-polyprenyl-1,4-benzoquinol methylase